MKNKCVMILCILLSLFFYAQKTEITNDKKATEHFKNHYKKKNYNRFSGKINFQENVIVFDNKTIFYDKKDKIITSVLKQGLIYPQLLTDYQMQKFLDENTDKTQRRFFKLQKDPRAAFDVNNIELSETSEIINGNNNIKVKRFKTNFRDRRLKVNSVYYFELINNSATKQMPLETFIEGSKLSYIGN
ncbi:hypothetical protein [Chryseobacterium echinoideorum]|uniref:hypothetical protein n=1 Tax=Chryseobacterium echinoideorum TaxID=1549648 RepID=UPI00118561BB|nr:hypothetical protein [Chryseobacterium echinoideorum]